MRHGMTTTQTKPAVSCQRCHGEVREIQLIAGTPTYQCVRCGWIFQGREPSPLEMTLAASIKRENLRREHDRLKAEAYAAAQRVMDVCREQAAAKKAWQAKQDALDAFERANAEALFGS